MSAPRYEVRTIGDMAAIPRDRWDAFLVDLTICVNAMRATNQVFDMGPEDTLDGALIWTDDDAPGCELTLRAPDGEPLFTTTAGEDA